MNCKHIALAVLCALTLDSTAVASGPRTFNPLEQKTKSFFETLPEELKVPEGVQEEHNFNLKDLAKYQGWTKECIDFSKSKKGKYCIIVDKASRTLDLYVRGELTKTYRIELGRDPFKDKTKEGDFRTPEGLYDIDFVHHDPSYHEGLRIGYPNSDDRKEFEKLKKEGVLSPKDTIGSAIFIHGEGTEEDKTPWDWTWGCMALTNLNIEDLYQRLGLGEFLKMNEEERRRTQYKFKKQLENTIVGVVRYGSRAHLNQFSR